MCLIKGLQLSSDTLPKNSALPKIIRQDASRYSPGHLINATTDRGTLPQKGDEQLDKELLSNKPVCVKEELNCQECQFFYHTWQRS